jgi:hypothetical protein
VSDNDAHLSEQKRSNALYASGQRDARAATVASLAQQWLGPNFMLELPAIRRARIDDAIIWADRLLAKAEEVSG